MFSSIIYLMSLQISSLNNLQLSKAALLFMALAVRASLCELNVDDTKLTTADRGREGMRNAFFSGDLGVNINVDSVEAVSKIRDRNLSKGTEKISSCFSSDQWCQFFELYIDLETLNPTSCPESTDWCPPSPVCNSTNIVCLRPGEFCRDEYSCRHVDNFPFCCQNCQNLAISCCPNWCSSCLDWETRCDLYQYFGSLDSSAYDAKRKFTQYSNSLCIPLDLMFLCEDVKAANLFCKGYVSDSLKGTEADFDCVSSCVDVVTDRNYCSCYEGH
jgi:hypothetical protein